MSYYVDKFSSTFLSLFREFVNVNFISEEMVWQIVPILPKRR